MAGMDRSSRIRNHGSAAMQQLPLVESHYLETWQVAVALNIGADPRIGSCNGLFKRLFGRFDRASQAREGTYLIKQCSIEGGYYWHIMWEHSQRWIE